MIDPGLFNPEAFGAGRAAGLGPRPVRGLVQSEPADSRPPAAHGRKGFADQLDESLALRHDRTREAARDRDEGSPVAQAAPAEPVREAVVQEQRADLEGRKDTADGAEPAATPNDSPNPPAGETARSTGDTPAPPADAGDGVPSQRPIAAQAFVALPGIESGVNLVAPALATPGKAAEASSTPPVREQAAGQAAAPQLPVTAFVTDPASDHAVESAIRAAVEGAVQEAADNGQPSLATESATGQADAADQDPGLDMAAFMDAADDGSGNDTAGSDTAGSDKGTRDRPFQQNSARQEPGSPAFSVARDSGPIGSASPLPPGSSPAVSGAAVVQDAPETGSTSTPAAGTADRIVQTLKFQFLRGGGDALVHIKPEHLGPVSVALRVEHGVVTAVVSAADPSVVEWLKANQDSLRDGMQAQGLLLERFVVSRDGSEQSRHRWEEAQRRDSRRRAPRPDSTFEIAV